MAEEEAHKVEPEPEAACDAPPPHPTDVAEEKSVVLPSAPDKEKEIEKPDDTKALAVVDKPEKTEESKLGGSLDRDAELARLETEKRLSLIKAWEESEKSKAENKAHKKISAIAAWENSKKASLEAELKKIEEKLEKKKAEYIEKTKNKMASRARRHRSPSPNGSEGGDGDGHGDIGESSNPKDPRITIEIEDGNLTEPNKVSRNSTKIFKQSLHEEGLT